MCRCKRIQMTEKTIKVDEAVHNRLEELKAKYNVETFNEVMRHELDIVSKTELDQLAAYFDDELRQTVEQVVDSIREIGEFDEFVTESGRQEVLEFIAPDSNALIASVHFDENSFRVKYRSQSGEMEDCGRGYDGSSSGTKYGRISRTSDSTDPEDVVNQAQKKITGSYKRWAN